MNGLNVHVMSSVVGVFNGVATVHSSIHICQAILRASFVNDAVAVDSDPERMTVQKHSTNRQLYGTS
jgi:hypothetical protein